MGCGSSKAKEEEDKATLPNQVNAIPVVKESKESEKPKEEEGGSGNAESPPQISTEVVSETHKAAESEPNEDQETITSTTAVMIS